MRSSILILLLAGLVSVPACSDATAPQSDLEQAFSVVGDWDVGIIYTNVDPDREIYWGVLDFRSNGWVQALANEVSSTPVRYTISTYISHTPKVEFTIEGQDGIVFDIVSEGEMRTPECRGGATKCFIATRSR